MTCIIQLHTNAFICSICIAVHVAIAMVGVVDMAVVRKSIKIIYTTVIVAWPDQAHIYLMHTCTTNEQ